MNEKLIIDVGVSGTDRLVADLNKTKTAAETTVNGLNLKVPFDVKPVESGMDKIKTRIQALTFEAKNAKQELAQLAKVNVDKAGMGGFWNNNHLTQKGSRFVKGMALPMIMQFMQGGDRAEKGEKRNKSDAMLDIGQDLFSNVVMGAAIGGPWGAVAGAAFTAVTAPSKELAKTLEEINKEGEQTGIFLKQSNTFLGKLGFQTEEDTQRQKAWREKKKDEKLVQMSAMLSGGEADWEDKSFKKQLKEIADSSKMFRLAGRFWGDDYRKAAGLTVDHERGLEGRKTDFEFFKAQQRAQKGASPDVRYMKYATSNINIGEDFKEQMRDAVTTGNFKAERNLKSVKETYEALSKSLQHANPETLSQMAISAVEDYKAASEGLLSEIKNTFGMLSGVSEGGDKFLAKFQDAERLKDLQEKETDARKMGRTQEADRYQAQAGQISIQRSISGEKLNLKKTIEALRKEAALNYSVPAATNWATADESYMMNQRNERTEKDAIMKADEADKLEKAIKEAQEQSALKIIEALAPLQASVDGIRTDRQGQDGVYTNPNS